MLDWWANGGIGVCALTGIGGAGKTAIVERFLQVLPGGYPRHPKVEKDGNLPAVDGMFVFSFYDAPNPDSLFAELEAWLVDTSNVENRHEVEGERRGPTSYRRILDRLQGAGKILVVLDGLEKVQEDGIRGRILGHISDGRLRDFLVNVADGLLEDVSVLTTSRFRLYDAMALRAWYLNDIAVNQIESEAAVKLLRERGVIQGSEAQLVRIAKNQGFHALGVDLLGGYIARFCDGSADRYANDTSQNSESRALDAVGNSDNFDPDIAAIRHQEQRFARLAEQYRQVLAENEPVALALLERISLFRLPVDAKVLASIISNRDIPEAGKAITGTYKDGIDSALSYLVELRLVERSQAGSASEEDFAGRSIEETADTDTEYYRYASHPAVRDAFSMSLSEEVRMRYHLVLSDGLLSGKFDSRIMAASRKALKKAGLRLGYISDAGTLDAYEEAIFHSVRAGRADHAFSLYYSDLGLFKSLGLLHGWYERGERICRTIAHRKPLVAESWDILLHDEWGRYLVELGRLEEASEVFNKAINLAGVRMLHHQAPTVQIHLAHVRRLQGRSVEALALHTGQIQSLPDTTIQMLNAVGLASVSSVLGRIEDALTNFNWALELQARALEYSDGLVGLRGVDQIAFLSRIHRDDQVLSLADLNISRIGRQHSAIPRCWLIKAEILASRKEIAQALEMWANAKEWALTHDATELLCWCALVRARVFLEELSWNSKIDEKKLLAILSEIGNGLRIASDCGYGYYRVDLLLASAELNIRRGLADDGLIDVESALGSDDKTIRMFDKPNALGAQHSEFNYAWGIALGRHLRAEAMILKAIQMRGKPSSRTAGFINSAKRDLRDALEMWRALRDPESNLDSNFVHPETGEHYNFSARGSYELLKKLESNEYLDVPLVKIPDIDVNVMRNADSSKTDATKDPALYDIFLSYNTRDKKNVKRLGQALKRRGLTVWLDDWELRPGLPWQDALERIVRECKAAAVCIGGSGVGPWEDPEMKALLRRFVDEKKDGVIVPIIPVILPGAPLDVELPTFLSAFSWVDLRAGVTRERLDLLEWGITGTKPIT
ncbi:toll/interleukin-1 receptor domain-containing protein [Cryptosporangium japonicum]|uniref:toll/interleukin-1 receptor domain-containing protein n=1 Tax=Cryptosporangium japonicum TaxID=80872 RepID=UPI0031CEB8FC